MKSIRTRIIFIVISIYLFTLLVFFLYSYQVKDKFIHLRFSEITASIKAEVEYVNKIISTIEQNAKDLALAGKLIYMNRHNIPPNQLEKTFSAALINNKLLLDTKGGSGIWFEPYAFDKNKRDFAVFVYKDNISDKMVTELFHGLSHYNYHNSVWYQQILPENAPRVLTTSERSSFWTVPLEWIMGRESRFISTIGAYIYDEQNTIVGIATVGWQTNDLIRTIEHINISPGSSILLADLNYNQVITCTFDSNIQRGQPLGNIEWFDKIGSKLPTFGEVNIDQMSTNGQFYYIFTMVTDNNMLLVSIVPAKEIIADLEKQFIYTILLLAAFGLTITIITGWLLNIMLNRPLKQLAIAAEKISTGVELKDYTEKASDEIGILINTFNKVISRNNQTLLNIIDNMPSSIYVTNPDTFELAYLNKHMNKNFPNAKEGAFCHKIFNNSDTPCDFCPLAGMDSNNQTQIKSVEVFKGGWFRLQASFIEWHGFRNYALLSAIDITQEVSERERLSLLAKTDSLTGILNRGGGIDALNSLLLLKKSHFITIVFADLNGLKKVNDEYGHQEGDFYITSAVRAIKENIRSGDFVSRMGGDEFLVVLENCPTETAKKLFEKINTYLKNTISEANKPYSGSMSYGIESFPTKTKLTAEQMLEKADQKMYLNKQKYYSNLARKS